MFMVALVVWAVLMSNGLWAADLTLETAEEPSANSRDESLAKSFSLSLAGDFLDSAALHWTKKHECFTCHTNYAYLLARPGISSDVRAHEQVRAALENLVEQRWEAEGPRWDAEVVMAAATLALNDAATTGTLHATTQKALARMWTVQKPNGGFDWLKCGWPPMESDDDFGIAMAALAMGAAPGGYAATAEAQAGTKQLQAYLRDNPPPTLHHQAMLLWAESYGTSLLTPAQRQQCISAMTALQKPDGGWAVANFGDWERSDDKLQDNDTSDGYATGLSIFVLRKSGVASSDPRIQHGIAWLKTHQRASGRWYTRSLNQDNKHFLSHAGTAFAVMALTSCDVK
ncbi:MAG: squalene--hopene cyclase [Planctomycetota bacterium]|nr:squalene--hopene cyclase [Planctomycetota bacterium]